MAETKSKLEKLLDKEGLTEQEAITALKGARKTPSKRRRITTPSNHIKYVCFSDAHIGHKEFQPELMDAVIQRANKDKVDFVVDPGDHLEGMSGRPGHIYELTHQGFSQQFEYAKEFYNQFKMPIFGIDGNHDAWYFKKNNGGVVVGQHLEDEVKNYTHLGQDEGWLDIGNGNDILLFHPNDGTAYATSYKLQKLIESFTGGEKPSIVHSGHYHKSMYAFIRNVHGFESGTLCFRPQVGITMADGTIKPICKVKEGDVILSHTNKKRKVLKKLVRRYDGDFIRIYVRKNDLKTSLCGTPEHPVLIERDGYKQWIPMNQIIEGDLAFIQTSSCEHCNRPIPFYNKFCNSCTPMNMETVQKKLSTTRGSITRDYTQRGSGWKHLTADIIPFCDDLNKKGWRAVPVGAGVIPDVVAFKDGELKLFELESHRGLSLQRKIKKYESAQIMNYVDSVEWINLKSQFQNATQIDFLYDEETGLVKVPIRFIKKIKSKAKTCKVYNLHVEGENSYLATRFAVHNCDQSQFMRGKKIPAHMGYWVVDVWHNKEGVKRIVPEFIPHYND